MLQSRGFNRSPSITFAKPNTSNHSVLYFPNFVRSTFNSPYSQKALQLLKYIRVIPKYFRVIPKYFRAIPKYFERTWSMHFRQPPKLLRAWIKFPECISSSRQCRNTGLGSFTLLGNDGLLKIIVFIRNLPFCNKMGGDTFGLKYGALKYALRINNGTL